MPIFRNLEKSDIEECWLIIHELKEHYDHPIGGDWSRNKIAEEIGSHFGVGVFDDRGGLMAFCLYHKIAELLEIMLLATRPRIHRAGAMRSLIRSLIADLNDDGAIWLEVHSGNLPAIALYESLGFKLTGERRGYYDDGGVALLFEYKPLQ